MTTPPTGKLKQLKVTYSFEDEKERTGERTVVRNQHEMLVLPEDMFLKGQIELLGQKLDKQITVTGLRSDDPRVDVRFVNDERGGYLEVVNRGKTEIQWIRVFPLVLSARTLTFDYIEPKLAPNERTTFSPNVGDQWGTVSNRNFIRALSEHWAKTSPSAAIREATSNCRIEYEDSDGTQFELFFELVYRTIERKEVECRNFAYRRIPKGITHRRSE